MTNAFYEFFAGGGMARLGLGAGWSCLLANDIDPKKMATYRANFGSDGTVLGDVAELTEKEMPGRPDLAWASFPCQDLSLAGNRVGLDGKRSGAFWGFWSAINKLKLGGRAPQLLVLENVCGLLTSRGGRDFHDLCRALASLGYDIGALVVDAVKFLPQSRPRLFIVCIQDMETAPSGLLSVPDRNWHTPALCAAVDSMPPDLKARWVWWKLPQPSAKAEPLSSLVVTDDKLASWDAPERTEQLLRMMSELNQEKITEAGASGALVVGTAYKRTRLEGNRRVQRAEARFDGIAGCLRTPGGGSSRQSVIVVEGSTVKSRLLSIREAARLMGVPDSYAIPANYNDGYHVFGDGLAVPAVSHIAKHLLEPILLSRKGSKRKFAA